MVNLGDVEGLLIDMDGTLVDSDAAVDRTWRKWALAHDVLPEAVAAVCRGATTEETIRRFRPDLDEATIAAQSIEHMRREAADTEGVVACEGAAELIEVLAELSLPWAVVTNADFTLATARLSAARIAPPVLTTVEEVPAGKPNPAIYHLGAARIGVAIERCLVVEDSTSGITAGLAAGACVVALRRDDGHVRIADLRELAASLRAARALSAG